MSKISRGQKGEELVIQELEKITEYHHLLNNVTFLNKKSEITHQIDHLLIHPNGFFVIETKNYYGEVIYDKNTRQWFKTSNGETTRISDPLLQNKSHQVSLYRILKSEYQIIPVVVFVQNNAPYFPNDNVINLKDLLLFVESYPYEHRYQKKTMDKIKQIVERKKSDVSLSDHVQNIEFLKQIIREQQAEITYAIENGKCPWCDSPISKSGNEYRCSRCNFKFKL